MNHDDLDDLNDVEMAELEEAIAAGNDVDLTEDVNKHKNRCTMCTGDTANNIWFVPRAVGYPGRCILDELTYDDVYRVLLKNPNAAKDLARVTDNPKLLSLAREVKPLVDPLDDDKIMANRLHANSLPFYTVLRGNSDGTPNGNR